MAHGQRGPSVMQSPPFGSRLAAHVDYLDSFSEGRPDWDCEHPVLRRLCADKLLRETPLHDAPFELVRDYEIIPFLQQNGMPTGEPEGWLRHLIDTETEACQAASRADAKANDKYALPSERKGGHPKPKAFPSAVVIAAFLDEFVNRVAGEKHNSLFEKVVGRLGPGIKRGTVRAIVRRCLPDLFDGPERFAFAEAICVVSEHMAELDRVRPPTNGFAPKPITFATYFRTNRDATIGVPTDGAPHASEFQPDANVARRRISHIDRSR